MDGFFRTVCETFSLAEAPNLLWKQYRQRMPELAVCRGEDLDALRRLRAAGMIGDNLIHDIAGGRAAGLRTIWLQPQHRPQPWSFTGPAPDFTADSVSDSVEVLLGEQ